MQILGTLVVLILISVLASGSVCAFVRWSKRASLTSSVEESSWLRIREYRRHLQISQIQLDGETEDTHALTDQHDDTKIISDCSHRGQTMSLQL